jgi:hypothetical protein
MRSAAGAACGAVPSFRLGRLGEAGERLPDDTRGGLYVPYAPGVEQGRAAVHDRAKCAEKWGLIRLSGQGKSDDGSSAR